MTPGTISAARHRGGRHVRRSLPSLPLPGGGGPGRHATAPVPLTPDLLTPVVPTPEVPTPLEPGPGAAPPADLARAVTGGAGWLAGSRLGGQVLQFAAGIILARLLTPTDFGLVASVYVITGFSVLFFDLGLSNALVQISRPTREDENTVFWVNALGGVVFALLIALMGPLIADAFGQPRLVRLAPLAALPFMLSVGVVQSATLLRALRMRGLAVIELSSTLVGFVVAVAAAFAGFGVYSLTLAPIVTAALISVLLWRVSPWRPTGFISWPSARRLWAFSGGALGFNVVNYWGRNADNFLVGRFLGAAELGFYGRAYNLMLLPVSQVSQVLGRVMMPALSGIKNDHARAARGYTRAVTLVDAMAVPILVGLAATAPALVPLLWGPRWVPTVPLLQILSVAGIPQCALASVGWIFQSQNRTGLMFRVGAASSGVGVIMMIVGLHWGVDGVAYAVLIRAWLSLLPELYFACRLIQLRARAVLRRIVGVNVAGGLMLGAVWAVPPVAGLDRTRIAALGLQVLAGLVVYPVALRLIDREVFAEIGRGARSVVRRTTRRAVHA